MIKQMLGTLPMVWLAALAVSLVGVDDVDAECDSRAFSQQRQQMVARQIVARGVKDTGVLEAMRAVPRH